MAESYISELGDSLSHGVANTNGDRVKIIAPKLYNDGNGNHPSIATALAGKAASNHSHGNIGDGGTLTDTAAAAAGNDYVVIRDADNAKIQTSTIKGTDVADAVSKKHSHSTLTLSTTAQAYDGTHTLALPSTDPYTSARTPASHTHGNITNGGALQTTDITIANGDKLVVTDASDSNKVARASLTFDGATTNQMLSKKGEWSDTIAKARAVVDYGSTSNAIEIGWAGASVNSPTHFAVYTDSEHGYKAIKDCSLVNARKAINGTSVGSTAVPVFINANGETQVCTDDFVHDGDVTSTYSSTGTAPVNGTAVASALGSYLPPSGSITANDDLNNYKTANRNYLCSATSASSVSNKPSGASGAFELEVIRGTGDTCVQIYYSRDDVSFNYIRKYTGSNAWTDWNRISLASDANGAYFATYGSTSHADVLAAVQAGKAVFCISGTDYAPLTGISSTSGVITFAKSTTGGVTMYYRLSTDDKWSSGTSADCRVAFSAISKSENTSDGCTLTFTAIDGTKKTVTVRNVVNAGNADTVGGYHIVVGSTGTDSKTIYFT